MPRSSEVDPKYRREARRNVDPDDYRTMSAYKRALAAEAIRLADEDDRPRSRRSETYEQRKRREREEKVRDRERKIRDELDRFDHASHSSSNIRRMAEQEVDEEDDKYGDMRGMYPGG